MKNRSFKVRKDVPIYIRVDYELIIAREAKKTHLAIDSRCAALMSILLNRFVSIFDECGNVDHLSLNEFKALSCAYFGTDGKLNFCIEALAKIGFIEIKHLDQESLSLVLNESLIARCLAALKEEGR